MLREFRFFLTSAALAAQISAEAVILLAVVAIASKDRPSVSWRLDHLWLAAHAALASLLAAGCVTGRNSPAPQLTEPNNLTASRALAAAKIDEDAWPQDEWWRAYGDSQLDSLVREALAG